MSLRTKTLSIIAVTLAVLAVTVYISSSEIVLGRFQNLEEDQAARDLNRARGAIDTEVTRINSVGGDWAAWDDTYAFVQGDHATYAEDNLSIDSLLNLHINMMLFYNADGELVQASGLDLQQEAEVDVPDTVLSSIEGVPGLLRFEGTSDSTSGLITTPEGPLLLSARPVITSERAGPIAGSFVIARYLDEALLADLSAVTELNLSAAPMGESAADVIEPLNSDNLTATTVLTDVTGQPAFGLQVEMPRDVYKEGQETIRYLLFALLVIGLVFGLLVTLLLERVVLKPVHTLSSFVQSVGSSLSKRAPQMGRDEIGRLARSVNKMLASIEQSSRELQQAHDALVEERAHVDELNRSLEQKVEERTNDLRIANEELRERNRQLIKARVLAATDGLTRLANHRSFFERVGAAGDNGRAVAVLMIDLDGFKQINDQKGHLVGDQMLISVAEVLRSIVGDESVFRYGGDEFSVLMEIASVEEARLLGERIRQAVFERLGESGLTVSVGIALYPQTASSPKEAVYQADSAMYIAKSEGKNAVRVWMYPTAAPALEQRRTA